MLKEAEKFLVIQLSFCEFNSYKRVQQIFEEESFLIKYKSLLSIKQISLKKI